MAKEIGGLGVLIWLTVYLVVHWFFNLVAVTGKPLDDIQGFEMAYG